MGRNHAIAQELEKLAKEKGWEIKEFAGEKPPYCIYEFIMKIERCHQETGNSKLQLGSRY